MDHLDHFRGTYSEKHDELEQHRDELIEQLRSFVPDNYLELIEKDEDGEPQHELKWVKVPDPRSDDPTPVLEVLPIVGLWRGQEEEEPFIAPGLSGLMLIGRLPDGGEAVIGSIDALGGDYDPLLTLNESRKDPSRRKMVEWETVDAELFIQLAKSALDAQAETPQSTESNIKGPTITAAQIERGSVALQALCLEWNLPLNPENLDLMAYAVLSNGGRPGKIEDVGPEELERIINDTRALLEEDTAAHKRMLEAQRRSIEEHRS